MSSYNIFLIWVQFLDYYAMRKSNLCTEIMGPIIYNHLKVKIHSNYYHKMGSYSAATYIWAIKPN
jgi:hypothetical protein